MSVGFHGEENFMSDFAIDVCSIIGISDDERCTKFFGLHTILFDQIPVDEAGICTTVDEGMFLDATLPLL